MDIKKNDVMIDVALSGYIGEICPQCNLRFESINDINERDPKWIGKLPSGETNKDGNICCKDCFSEYSQNKLN